VAGALTVLDALVVGAYLAAVLGLSFVIARGQRTGSEYFLAGRGMPGAVLAISILANQASAVSLVGAPAFVALRPDGGLRWLQYELALPVAMFVAMVLLVPSLRRLRGASIYAFVEDRFGRPARRAVAGAFLLSRGLALGVVLYASALVVAHALGWPVDTAIVALGLFALAYTSLGGIVADIWSDVAQFAVLWCGTLVGAGVILARHGTGILAAVPPERMQALVLDGSEAATAAFGFWPMLVGGLFLYLSYYACDQTQAQRLLTARSDGAAGRALLLNGLLRFPLVATYCFLGLLLAGLLVRDPAFAAAMTGRSADELVPVFMMSALPTGLRGLFLAGILAAAMSSIDSALNSLAAVTLEDVAGRDATTVRVAVGRLTSLAWGLFAIGSGLVFARTGGGVLELINRVGSAFYGPILAVFVLGVLAPRTSGTGALAGLGAGLVANAALGTFAPGVPWLWWNPAGFLVAALTARVISRAMPVWPALPASARRDGAVLGFAFAAMLALLAALPRLLGA